MQRRSLWAHVARTAAFGALAVALFVGALWTSSKVHYGERMLLQHLTGNHLEPGGKFQSLRRFREVDTRGDVDIAFFGSSHGYRGFDTRVFAEAGHSAYNLGSTNQTPLNSYYLAKRYLPALNPQLVVIEVYYGTLESDGLEAYRDIAVNTPWSWQMLSMAVATRQLGAINFGVAKGLGLVTDESRVAQQPIAGETYIPGGYCESRTRRQKLAPGANITANINERQFDYLVDVSAYARSIGARVVWVTHPFPQDHVDGITNYDEVQRDIAGAAKRADVIYWDFNGRVPLDPLNDFKDFHHLNFWGVEKFNRALLAQLRSAGYLPKPRSGR